MTPAAFELTVTLPVLLPTEPGSNVYRIVQLSPWPPTAGWGDNLHSVIERSFLVQADLFSFGMAVAVLYVLVTRGDVKLPRQWRPPAVARPRSGRARFPT